MQFSGNKGYEGMISYVQSVRQQNQDTKSSIHQGQCNTNCTTCQDAQDITKTGDEKGYLIAKAIKGKFSVVTGACTKCASRYVLRYLMNRYIDFGLF